MAYKLVAECDRCGVSEMLKIADTAASVMMPATPPKDWMRAGHWDGLCRKCSEEKDVIRHRHSQEMDAFLKSNKGGF
jgi:hypothetical protein